MNFHYDCKNGKRQIIGTPEGVIQVDHKRVGFINRNPFLLNVEVRQTDTLQFAYDISGKTNYLAWQSEASREQVMEMERKIAELLSAFAQAGISLENIIQEKRYMYVDDIEREINLICIPAATGEKKAVKKTVKNAAPKQEVNRIEIPPLPDEIPVPPSDEIYDDYSGIKPNKKTDSTWGEDPEEDIEEFFKREINPAAPEPEYRPKPLFEEMGEPFEKPVKDESPYADWRNEEKYAPVQEEKYTAPKENTEFQEEDEEDGTVLLSDYEDDDDEKTMLLIPKPNGKAYLENVKTKEKFHIVKAATKIGKKKVEVDIWIGGNPTISRLHCTINYLKGKYYITDNGSLNFTYVNEKKLEKEESCALTDGCTVKLSDEEFIFRTGEE